jgi:hypothetical protein
MDLRVCLPDVSPLLCCPPFVFVPRPQWSSAPLPTGASGKKPLGPSEFQHCVTFVGVAEPPHFTVLRFSRPLSSLVSATTSSHHSSLSRTSPQHILSCITRSSSYAQWTPINPPLPLSFPPSLSLSFNLFLTMSLILLLSITPSLPPLVG